VTVTVWCARPHLYVASAADSLCAAGPFRSLSQCLNSALYSPVLSSSGQTCRAARKNCMPAAAMMYMPEISAAMRT
jgi:hypothetical protein